MATTPRPRRHSYCARCGVDRHENRRFRYTCEAYGGDSYPQHIWMWDCDDDCDEHGGDSGRRT
jgi:hypothetical protein